MLYIHEIIMENILFSFLLFSLFLKVLAFVYTDQHGVRISYKVTFQTFCDNKVDTIAILVGIQLRECVRECVTRPHCQGLRYHRRSTLCELLSKTEDYHITKGGCIFIPASDIVVEKVPCQTCARGQTCDIETNVCKKKECLQTDLSNGVITSNMKHVGDKLQYQCNEGYKDVSGNVNIVCLDDDTRNISAVCQKVVENVALGKPTSMSSYHHSYVGSQGVDGNVTTFFHTENEINPWWRVDLGSIYKIFNVTLYNRVDCCQERASQLILKLGMTTETMVEYDSLEVLEQNKTFLLPDKTFARYVEVRLMSTNFLHLGEVEVMAIPVSGK